MQNAPYPFLPYCRNPHLSLQPQMKGNTKGSLGRVHTCTGCMECFDENATPDLESYAEDLCSPHDSSIFLGLAYGAVLPTIRNFPETSGILAHLSKRSGIRKKHVEIQKHPEFQE